MLRPKLSVMKWNRAALVVYHVMPGRQSHYP